MKKLLFFLLPIAYSLLPINPAYAADNTITVNPSLIQLDLATDTPQATLTYTNNSPDTIDISLSAQDFTDLNNGYTLSFLKPQDANNYTYSLASWIAFSTKTIVIPPHQSQQVTVFIQAQKLSPGGHYASILASVNPDATTQDPVALKAVLASLLFVRTHTGKEIASALLPTFEIQRNLFDFPDSASFRFDNTGDTQLVPYGLVQILDSQGHEVAKGIVNEASSMTLPQSIRRYYVPLTNLQPLILPGIYTATIDLHFGQNPTHRKAQTTFFTQGSLPLLDVGIAIAVCGAFLMWLKKSKNAK